MYGSKVTHSTGSAHSFRGFQMSENAYWTIMINQSYKILVPHHKQKIGMSKCNNCDTPCEKGNYLCTYHALLEERPICSVTFCRYHVEVGKKMCTKHFHELKSIKCIKCKEYPPEKGDSICTECKIISNHEVKIVNTKLLKRVDVYHTTIV
jgi:hypothetical protein